MDKKPISKVVIIVGAGPSGLLLALLLSSLSNPNPIPVQIFEASPTLDTNPRAAYYAPSAVRELRRAGILDDVIREGFIASDICWRKIDGEYVAGMKFSLEGDGDEKTAVLPLDGLLRVMWRHLEGRKDVEVMMGRRVVGVSQDEEKAMVSVQDGNGEMKQFAADYVVGCDGANSIVRKSLFEKKFEGETLDEQIIATNVYYNFTKFKPLSANFILHPTNWYMAAQISTKGHWRVTYGDIPGLTKEEYAKRQPQRYEEILPEHPKPGEYKLTGISPYKLQQRCADSFRVGRVLLAADAAHLCNPFGGMGLTSGIADITSLYDCLAAIQNGLTNDSILDKYSEIRIKKWREIVDPVSRSNFRRLWDSSESTERERKELFEQCHRMNGNRELEKEALEFTYSLNEDLTPYFTHGINGKLPNMGVES